MAIFKTQSRLNYENYFMKFVLFKLDPRYGSLKKETAKVNLFLLAVCANEELAKPLSTNVLCSAAAVLFSGLFHGGNVRRAVKATSPMKNLILNL